jgi:glutamine synthetase
MAGNGRTPPDVIEFAKQNNILMVDLKLVDLLGTMQHITLPVEEMTTELFEEGTGFDGSSIRGFQPIDESDMLLVPDASTAAIDTVLDIPTLSMICDVRDPVTGGNYGRDPRWIAQKSEAFLVSSGIADISYWGPELEFFIFDTARFDQNAHSAYYFVDSDEGIWNSGSEFTLDGELNQGYRPRHKEGYFPSPPVDTQTDLRSEAVLKMSGFGLQIEKHHHEVATAGQGEIDFKYDSLTRTADNVMIYKYVLKNVAKEHGKVATFMPKPLFEDNGTGMHTHQSLWKDGRNIFHGDGYANMSETMKNYIGGLLAHAPALMAFCAPTTNSYRRLVPGFEAPVNLAYSARNRSACARIPMYFSSPAARRIEFRPPDPACNPYLAFPAMLMAGIDGIINKTDPGEPLDVNLYELSPEQAENVKQVPGSLPEAIDALEADHEFLLRGDVFTKDIIDLWLDFKRSKEIDEVRLRPHPYEFILYFDA